MPDTVKKPTIYLRFTIQADFDEINTTVLELEQKYHDLTNLHINPLKERKVELNMLIRDKMKQLNELKVRILDRV